MSRRTVENNLSRLAIEQAFRQLKLPTMWEAFQEQLKDPIYSQMTFEKRVGILLSKELQARTIKRQLRLLKSSGIRGKFSDISKMDYSKERNLDAGLVQFLAECQWITEDNPASVIVTGATGTGKTWLIEALGKCACRQGLTVQYFRMPVLLELMDKARKDSKCLNFREKINKKKLLIIDDFAMGVLDDSQRSDLFSLIDERKGDGATIIASQKPLPDWYNFFGDPYHADALLDRLKNHSYTIELKGDSLREKYESKLEEQMS